MVEMLLRRSFFFGAIVPLALLAGQLSTLAHSMAVDHDRCPEHGELVHRVVGPAPLMVGAAADVLASVGAVALVASHGHEHCVTLWGRREIIGAPPRPAIGVAPPPRTGAPSIGVPWCGARAVLLSLAPKTSPPAST